MHVASCHSRPFVGGLVRAIEQVRATDVAIVNLQFSGPDLLQGMIPSYEPPVAQVCEGLAGWKVKALGGAQVRGGDERAGGGRSEVPERPWGRRKRDGNAPTPPDSVFFAQASSTAGCSGP
jgi:hypothetical protein